MKRSLAYCFLYFSTDYPSWRKFSARGTDMNAMKIAFRRLSRPVFSHLTGFKTTFTLFPLFSLISSRVCLFSRRLLTRTAWLGTGWGFVKSRTTLISPGEAAASETKFPYRSVHRSHRRKKFAFWITREASERERERARPSGCLELTEENGRPIVSFDFSGDEVLRNTSEKFTKFSQILAIEEWRKICAALRG